MAVKYKMSTAVMFSTLKNAVTLITGGASGLGKAAAERFVRAGSKVIICDLPSSKGKDVANELGKDCIFAPTDVTSESDVAAAVKLAEDKFGRLDNVINCAGIGVACRSYNFGNQRPHSQDLFNKTLLTNVGGTFNVIRQCVGLINKKVVGEVLPDTCLGVIINTSSVAAYDGQIGQVAYAASKGAIASMTLPLARDFCARGIRVVCIAPGLFDTPLMQSLPEKVRTSLAQTVPFPRRLGFPEEYAHLCQSIVENKMLNGEVIRLDGSIRMMP